MRSRTQSAFLCSLLLAMTIWCPTTCSADSMALPTCKTNREIESTNASAQKRVIDVAKRLERRERRFDFLSSKLQKAKTREVRILIRKKLIALANSIIRERKF